MPSVDVFISNHYKHRERPDISIDTLKRIANFNSFGVGKGIRRLFAFVAMFNHSGTECNVHVEFVLPNVVMLFAGRDIMPGEELLFDYVSGAKGKEERNVKLARYGITE